jgi:hypothetical protein
MHARAKLAMIDQAAVEQRGPLVAACCSEIDAALMNEGTINAALFELMTGLLSSSAAVENEAICGLFMTLGTEFERLSEAQKAGLLSALDDNCGLYGSDPVKFLVPDLVARHYPPAVALRLFTQWAGQRDAPVHWLAYFGCDVLRIQSATAADIRHQAIALQGRIKQTNPSFS